MRCKSRSGPQIDIEEWRSTTNALGFHGIKVQGKRFQAKGLVSAGKGSYLGTYDTPEEAALAYAKAYMSVHGKTKNQMLSEAGQREDEKVCEDGDEDQNEGERNPNPNPNASLSPSPSQIPPDTDLNN